MGIVDKLKEKFEHTHIGSSINKFEVNKNSNFTKTLEIDTPTKRVIYRNRFNNGVNLGALFVLESWIFDSQLTECGGNCELECVGNISQKLSPNEAVKRLSEHYKQYIDKIDWVWLRDVAKITAIRVPIGYWHVNNGGFTKGLPFEPLMEIYEKAKPWYIFKSLIEKANQYNIGILIDIHGLPGGANNESHSGDVTGNSSFFNTPKYVNKMINEIIPFIVKDTALPYENIIGIQIVNEAKFNEKGKAEKDYYERAIKVINQLDPQLPIVISDGWWPEQWSDWLNKRKFDSFVVIDSHVYRCFSDEDKSKTAQEIIKSLKNTVSFPYDKADFVVGEFSCVLDEQTWSKTDGIKEALVKQFGNEQINIFNKVASWGWFFWTLQFQWGDGGEWGFVPQVNSGTIPLRKKTSIEIDDKEMNSIFEEHVNYWSDKGENFEHERYKDGLRQAINDIQNFDKFDNSRIGRLHSWTLMRREQYIKTHGDSEFMWEWDQGYQRGILEFNK